MTATEYVILVDQNDQEIGIAEKLRAHQLNQCHRAFSIFIFSNTTPHSKINAHSRLLLQQRATTKYHSAGLWTNTCCSHPRPGESILAAGERRLKEEFGIDTILYNIGWFHYQVPFANGLTENEIDHVLVGTIDLTTPLHPDPNEINAYRWVSMDELHQELKTHLIHFTPWFKQALGMVYP